jgi:hypothetical protein
METVDEYVDYSTSDIALASYLYCSGAQLRGLDRSNPHRCIFIFKSPSKDSILKWQKGEAVVNAMSFYNAYQLMKAEVYENWDK